MNTAIERIERIERNRQWTIPSGVDGRSLESVPL